jgi:hypothetical protein
MTDATDKRLLDAAIDAYVDWRETSAGVWDAYQQWARAAVADAALAFTAYQAAVDREERASCIYADAMRRTATMPPVDTASTGLPPTPGR